MSSLEQLEFADDIALLTQKQQDVLQGGGCQGFKGKDERN